MRLVTLSIFTAVVLTTVGALRWSGEVHPHRVALFAQRQTLVVGMHPWAIAVTAPAPTPP
jgi:hypothetical protein